MHPSRRFLFLAVLCVAIVPLTGTAVLLSSVTGRGDLEWEFQKTLEKAKASYGRRAGVGTTQKVTQQTVNDAQAKLTEIGKAKRAIRFQIITMRNAVADIRNRRDALVVEGNRLDRLYRIGKERFLELVQSGRIQIPGRQEGVRYVFRRLLSLSLGTGLERDFQETYLARAREEYLVSLLTAKESTAQSQDALSTSLVEAEQALADLGQEREELIVAYGEADDAYEEALRTVQVSEEQLQAIKAEMGRVHSDVLRLQAEMARIDARIREKAKRKLIDMGLMDAQESDGTVKLPSVTFGWPVYGPVTAGFQDQAYLKRFRVPHNAVDIAQPQGSSVTVAADGVVFLVRDGGARGYSYLLVGHRDGYATLYGHISSFAVSPGEDVRQGQVIGLSGGQPGTHGAGLLTTGPHLHFEVIKAGSNINPLTVLP